MNKRFVLLALLALPLCGCSTVAKLAAELKDDPAIIVTKIGTPWGVQSLVRVGPQSTNSVTILPDGSITITPTLPK